jgi:NADH-quinone oxidoreductase subunit F
VEKILDGRGTQADLETILRVSDLMAGKTICALADAMAWPAVAFIKKYPQEFAALCAGPVDMDGLAEAVGRHDHILPKAS